MVIIWRGDGEECFPKIGNLCLCFVFVAVIHKGHRIASAVSNRTIKGECVLCFFAVTENKSIAKIERHDSIAINDGHDRKGSLAFFCVDQIAFWVI